MHILFLELKRVIKSRMTWILLVIAIALSVIVSLRVVSLARYTYVDKSGNQITISGMDAIHANQEKMQPYEGEIAESTLQNALKTEQDLFKQYGEDFPMDVYRTKLVPIEPFLNMISEVYPKSGDEYEALAKVDPDELTSFYQQRSETLKNEIEAKYPGNKNVLQQVQRLNEKVSTPFEFHYGYDSNASDNLELLIFVLVLISTMIVSPIFSAEYQNGSDDILRCTKNGRAKFAIIKLLSSLIITLIMFVICALAFVLIVNTAYGWNSLHTSTQVLMSALNFVPFMMGQEQGLTILAGLLTLWAVTCFTLFLSTKCRNSTTTLIIAFAFCLLPTILFSVGQGNVINLLTCLLPAGGTGLTNSFCYQLNQITFIQIGSFNTWAPYLMMGAAIIEIPLFFVLSIHAYCKHQVS